MAEFLKRHTNKGYKLKYNVYDLSKEYGIGFTTNTNQEFYFDLEDFDKIKDYCWNEDDNGYITTRFTLNGKDIHYKLHRMIMNIDDENIQVDHKFQNPKDNRKEFLRIVTDQQNKINRGLRKDSPTKVVGVTWYEKYGKWRARIGVNKKTITLGYFDNFEEAVKSRKEAEEKYFGEYSYKGE